MRGREVAEAVLDLVQVLDQQVALARRRAEQLRRISASACGDRRGGPLGAAALALAAVVRACDGAIGMMRRRGELQSLRAGPAPRAHWYLAPSTATGISVE